MDNQDASGKSQGRSTQRAKKSLLGEIWWNLQWSFLIGIPFLAIMEFVIYLVTGEFNVKSITSGLSILLFINILFVLKEVADRRERGKKKL